MLKDRVTLTESGFRVFAEQGSKCRLYYKMFTLKDNTDDLGGMTEISYWDPVRTSEIMIPKSSFILIAEKMDETITDIYRFYFAAGKKKSQLAISVKPKSFYGKGACMITVEWVDCKGESIQSRYIYLKDRDGEKYHFLQDVIEPLKPDGKKLMDQYIFTVPRDHKLEDYVVEVDPLVREKYKIL